jgi:hypothetical protein
MRGVFEVTLVTTLNADFHDVLSYKGFRALREKDAPAILLGGSQARQARDLDDPAGKLAS